MTKLLTGLAVIAVGYFGSKILAKIAEKIFMGDFSIDLDLMPDIEDVQAE